MEYSIVLKLRLDGIPRGMMMSAYAFVGSMYESNAGLTNLSYCFRTPLKSRPLWLISLDSLRHNRISESVSTKIFKSSRSRTSLLTNDIIPGTFFRVRTQLFITTYGAQKVTEVFSV